MFTGGKKGNNFLAKKKRKKCPFTNIGAINVVRYLRY
jgi:hypothetical protein